VNWVDEIDLLLEEQPIPSSKKEKSKIREEFEELSQDPPSSSISLKIGKNYQSQGASKSKSSERNEEASEKSFSVIVSN